MQNWGVLAFADTVEFGVPIVLLLGILLGARSVILAYHVRQTRQHPDEASKRYLAFRQQGVRFRGFSILFTIEVSYLALFS